ncbi:hypothetical protein GCM10011405_30410 [Rufibacter glacialis]|nr:hypothetical protein GCM10011405_30410 [Rufibacter glacialis]
MPILLPTLLGLLAVTAIDFFGSLASRRLGFNYALLTPLSLITYAFIGYWVSKESALPWAILSACAVGVYDATVGWSIALRMGANLGQDPRAQQSGLRQRLTAMLGISSVCALVGHYLA